MATFRGWRRPQVACEGWRRAQPGPARRSSWREVARLEAGLAAHWRDVTRADAGLAAHWRNVARVDAGLAPPAQARAGQARHLRAAPALRCGLPRWCVRGRPALRMTDAVRDMAGWCGWFRARGGAAGRAGALVSAWRGRAFGRPRGSAAGLLLPSLAGLQWPADTPARPSVAGRSRPRAPVARIRCCRPWRDFNGWRIPRPGLPWPGVRQAARQCRASGLPHPLGWWVRCSFCRCSRATRV